MLPALNMVVRDKEAGLKSTLFFYLANGTCVRILYDHSCSYEGKTAAFIADYNKVDLKFRKGVILPDIINVQNECCRTRVIKRVNCL